MTHLCHLQLRRSFHPHSLWHDHQRRVLRCTTFGKLCSDNRFIKVKSRSYGPNCVQPITHVLISSSVTNEFRYFSEVFGFSTSIAWGIMKDKWIVLLWEHFLVDVGLSWCIFGYFLRRRIHQQGGNNAQFTTYSDVYFQDVIDKRWFADSFLNLDQYFARGKHNWALSTNLPYDEDAESIGV